MIFARRFFKAADVMEYVLLRDPRIRSELVRLHPGEVPIHSALHPHVDGKSVQTVEAVEQGTFRHLDAHAEDLHQRRARLRERERPDRLKIDRPKRAVMPTGYIWRGSRCAAARDPPQIIRPDVPAREISRFRQNARTAARRSP